MGKETGETGVVSVRKPRADLEAHLKTARGAIERVAAKHIDLDRMVNVVLLLSAQQPELLKCAPVSIVRAVMQCAEMGLELGSGFGHAYLVPYYNSDREQKEAKLIVGYQGYIELVLRTGKVRSVRAKPVFADDLFRYEEGTTPSIVHTPNLDAEERDFEHLRAVYAIAELGDGAVLSEVMSRRDVEAVRKRSKSFSSKSPWVTDPVEMARKTAVRRLQKYLPKTREIAQAIALDEDDEGALGGLDAFRGSEVLPPETEKPKAALADKVKGHTEWTEGKGDPRAVEQEMRATRDPDQQQEE